MLNEKLNVFAFYITFKFNGGEKVGAQYIVAHDVGTSGSKAVLVDLYGNIYASDSEKYNLYYPCANWVEQEPEEYWNAITKTTRNVLKKSGISPEEVIGMAYSTQILAIIPMNKSGKVLSRAINWMDGRAEKQAKEIMNKFGGAAIFSKLAGAVLTGKDGLAKLVWIKENQPELYEEMDCFLDVNGYLTYKATGKRVMEWSCASAFAFDLKKKDWMNMIIKHIGLDQNKFPKLVKSTDIVGGLTDKAAEECGLIAGTPILGGSGDMQNSSIGSGSVGEEDGYIYLGTSAWVSISTNKTKTGCRGVYNFQSADPSKCLVVGEMESAGACLKWVADEFYRHEQEDPNIPNVYDLMDRDVEKVPPGSDYLIFTPWICGERCPISDTDVRATFFNLSAVHKREYMLRAIYEGIAYNMRWIMEIIHEIYGFDLNVLKMVGGGALDDQWMQIIADITHKRVETLRNPQMIGAIGTAMIAAVGLGKYKDFDSIKEIAQIDKTYDPNPVNAQIYDDIYSSFKDMYPALKKLYHQINSTRFRNCTAYKTHNAGYVSCNK